MKALLTQMALIMGAVVSGFSLLLNLSKGMDLLIAVFRGTLVFFGTVIVLFVFLRFFSTILVRFVAEQVLQNRPENPDDDKPETGASAKADPAPGVPRRTSGSHS